MVVVLGSFLVLANCFLILFGTLIMIIRAADKVWAPRH